MLIRPFPCLEYVVFAKRRTKKLLRVNYTLDYTSNDLILSNLYCKLYYLFLHAKRHRKVDDLFNIFPHE